MAQAMTAYQDSRVVLARKKRKVFLRVLAETGQVTEASRACGYTTPTTLQRFRRENEDFAEEWDDALQAAKHMLADEIWRRAKDGVLEPQFHKGEIVGYVPKYSDTLAMFILRKLDPSYRDNQRGGDMTINFGIAVVPMTAKDDGQWEQRAVQMHDEQKVITIEAKPEENQMTRIKRGD